MQVLKWEISTSLLIILLTCQIFVYKPANGDPFINVNAVIPCFKVVCYREVGCITPFISLMVILVPPISICPDSPKEINVTYHLITPNVKKSEFGTLKDLKSGTNLAFYSHGCFSSYADKLTLVAGLALFHKYEQVIMIDWTRGANPRMFGKISIPLINIFLCAANSEVLGRLVAIAMHYAITEKKIEPSKIMFAGHSAGSHATSFAGGYLQDRYGIMIGETVALDSSTSPFALSTKRMPGSGDALIVTKVMSTFNFPIPVISDFRAMTFLLGYPFPTADTDIFLNPPYYFQTQIICTTFPMCSHFYSVLAFVGSLRNCLYESRPCYPSFKELFSQINTTYTGVRSSVFGKRGALCFRTPLNPLKGCECCSSISRLQNDDNNENNPPNCPRPIAEEFVKYYR